MQKFIPDAPSWNMLVLDGLTVKNAFIQAGKKFTKVTEITSFWPFKQKLDGNRERLRVVIGISDPI